MKAVVLAAGRGQRLSETGPSLPKPLVPLAGKPLVGHTLHALAEAGVTDVLVVTGYGAKAVRQGAQEWARSPLAFADNPRFHLGASCSLAAARPFCADEPFLLVMCDHAFSPQLLATLLESAADPLGDSCRVAADRAPRGEGYVAEATKLAVDADGFVTAIGKALPAWDALDAGAFLCTPAVWQAVDAAPEDCGLSDIFALLARDSLLLAADITGRFWYDIDTPADLREAERLFAARASAATADRLR